MPNARIRMIAVDLDGTLLNSRKQIADQDRAALLEAAARGVEIVPVTGRSYSTALPLVAELLSGGPLIASNGAIIRSKDGVTHQRGLLPAAVAAEVLRITPEFRHYTVLTYDQHGEGQFRIEVPGGNGPGNVVSRPASSLLLPPDGVASSPWIARYKSAVRFTESLEGALDGDPVEIMFAGPVESMQEVEARLQTMRDVKKAEQEKALSFRLLRTEYPERNFSIVDVIRHDCSKGHAVEFWSRFRGLRREEIMAIGDNYNDLEMLRFVGTPVVMGNAEEALKQHGWPVTLDCNSGGVAQAVEQYVLGNRK